MERYPVYVSMLLL